MVYAAEGTREKKFMDELRYGKNQLAISLMKRLIIANNPLAQAWDDFGITPLMIAVEKYGSASMVDTLLKNGANPNHIDDNGQTALHKLTTVNKAGKDDVEIAKMLIKAGVEINHKDKFGRTALDYAKEKSKIELTKILENPPKFEKNYKQEFEADYEKQKEKSRDRREQLKLEDSLLDAAEAGNAEKVKSCLDKGADANSSRVVDYHSSTALILATKSGSIETVKLLLESGARTTDKDDDKYTAMDYARQRVNVDMVNLLKQHEKKAETKPEPKKTKSVE